MAWETVTIKYDGEFKSVPIAGLDIGDIENPTDAEVKTAMASEVGADNLNEYRVDHDVNGKVINLRPAAEFGRPATATPALVAK